MKNLTTAGDVLMIQTSECIDLGGNVQGVVCVKSGCFELFCGFKGFSSPGFGFDKVYGMG